MSEPILETLVLTKRFGGLAAVNKLDLQVEVNSIHAIIGPNGAGKTTLFNLITGIIPPTSGTILFQRRLLKDTPPYERVRLGIRRTFQNIRLFEELTVIENVILGQHSKVTSGFVSLLTTRSGAERKHQQEAEEILEILGIADLRNRRAGELAYGPKRVVEIARALASHPALLLLDEPTAGMNPKETEGVSYLILALQQRGISIIVIEHHMHVVTNISSRITVLNFGEKIAEGSPEEVLNHPAVVDAYLGKVDIE